MACLQVENLAQQQLEAPKYLRHQAQREWCEIHDNTLRFDRVQQEVAALRALTQHQLLAFFQVRDQTLWYILCCIWYMLTLHGMVCTHMCVGWNAALLRHTATEQVRQGLVTCL